MRELPKWKNATCRGSYLFGSACGHCERCECEMKKLQESGEIKPVPPTPDSMTCKCENFNKDIIDTSDCPIHRGNTIADSTDSWVEKYGEIYKTWKKEPGQVNFADIEILLGRIKSFISEVRQKAVEETLRGVYNIATDEINQSSAQQVPIYVKQMQAIQIYAKSKGIEL